MEASISKRLKITESGEEPPLLILSRLSDASLRDVVNELKSREGGKTRLNPGKLALDTMTLALPKIAEFLDPLTCGRMIRVSKRFEKENVRVAVKKSLDIHQIRGLRNRKMAKAFEALRTLSDGPNRVALHYPDSAIYGPDIFSPLFYFLVDFALMNDVYAWGSKHFHASKEVANGYVFMPKSRKYKVIVRFNNADNMKLATSSTEPCAFSTTYDLFTRSYMFRRNRWWNEGIKF